MTARRPKLDAIDAQRLIGKPEACALLDCGSTKFDQMLADKVLRRYRMGNRVKVRYADVLALIERMAA